MMNINLPEGPLEGFKGTRVTKLGNRVYQNVITDKVDPHGKPYFWIGGQGPTWARNEGTGERLLTPARPARSHPTTSLPKGG